MGKHLLEISKILQTSWGQRRETISYLFRKVVKVVNNGLLTTQALVFIAHIKNN